MSVGEALWTAEIPVRDAAGQVEVHRLASSGYATRREDLGYHIALRQSSAAGHVLATPARAVGGFTGGEITLLWVGALASLPSLTGPLLRREKLTGNVEHGDFHVTADGRLGYRVGFEQVWSSSGLIAAGAPLVAAYTQAGSVYTFYLGLHGEPLVAVASGTIFTPIPTAAVAVVIGRDESLGAVLDAEWWSAGIYDRALTAAEIFERSNHHLPVGNLASNLRAAWVARDIAPDGVIPNRVAGGEPLQPTGTALEPIFIRDGYHVQARQFGERISGLLLEHTRHTDTPGGLAETHVTLEALSSGLEAMTAAGSTARDERLDLRLGTQSLRYGEFAPLGRARLDTARSSDEGRHVIVKASSGGLDLPLRTDRYMGLGNALAGGGISLGMGRSAADPNKGDLLLDPQGGLTCGLTLYISESASGQWVNLLSRRKSASNAESAILLSVTPNGVRAMVRDEDDVAHAVLGAPAPIEEWFRLELRWSPGDGLAVGVNGVFSAPAPVGALYGATGIALMFIATGVDLLVTEITWANKALAVEDLAARALRPLLPAEIPDYAFYLPTHLVKPSTPPMLYDAGPNKLDATIFAGGELIETLTGSAEVAGKHLPHVLGSVRRVPGVSLSASGLHWQFHGGPCAIGDLEAGGVDLWRHAELHVAVTYPKPNVIELAEPMTWEKSFRRFTPGQIIEITGGFNDSKRAIVHTVERHRLTVHGDDPFTVVGTAALVDISTVAPDPQSSLDLTFLTSNGVNTITAAEGSFREGYRDGQFFTVALTASNNASFELAETPVEPFSTLVVVQDVADEDAPGAKLTWQEAIDATVDETEGTVSLLRRPSKPVSASIEAGDTTATKVVESLLRQAGQDATFGDLGSNEIGHYAGPDDGITIRETLEHLSGGLARSIGLDPTTGYWTSWRRQPIDPATAPDLVLDDDNVLALRPGTVTDAYSAVRVRYGRNHVPLGDGDVAGNGTLGDRGDEWLSVVVGDPSAGPELVIDTPIRTRDEARQIAIELLAWYGEERRLDEVELPLSMVPMIAGDPVIHVSSKSIPVLANGHLMRVTGFVVRDFQLTVTLEG